MRTSFALSFQEMLFSSLQSSPLLDHMVVERLPDPWLVTSPLSSAVQDELLSMSGLRGKKIVAASTENQVLIQTFIDGPNPSVIRALSYNKNLTKEHAFALADRAVRNRDGGLVLALVRGRRDLGSILSRHPKILQLLSDKDGHPGNDAITRTLLLLPLNELKKALPHLSLPSLNIAKHTKFAYPIPSCRALLRISNNGRSGEHLTDPSYDETQVVSFYKTLPEWLRVSLIEAIALDPRVSKVETALLMSEKLSDWETPASWSSPRGTWDTRWSNPALWSIAERCADALHTRASLSLFESMLPTWREDLTSLLQVCDLAN